MAAGAAAAALALAGGPALADSAVPAATGKPASPPPGCPAGGLVTDTVPLPSGVHVTPNGNDINVLLPPGYCDPRDAHLYYPVLYLLHGAGDTYQAWATNTDLVSFYEHHVSDQPIIVMPDGGRNAQAGWYSNWLGGEYQWETYHIDVLQAYINGRYRTVPGDVGIAGLSMGGFGAMSYAGRHPGMFKVAASFSGALDMLYGAPATGVVFSELNSQYGTPNDQVWGNQLTDYSKWERHNPASLAAELKGTVVLLACGTGTPGGAYGDDPADPGGYALENGVFQMNLSMVRALTLAGVPFQQHFYPGGYHGWPYWQADMHWALPIIDGVLGPPQRRR
jgi:diacylglycerol O-acyltransferase/trehalose O-mycolyltransferase